MKKRFIFDENYIKRYAKKDKIKWLVIGASALVLVLIVIVVILANRNKKDPVKPVTPVFELKEELVIEAGGTIPEVVDYFKTLENVDVDGIKVTYPEDFEISYDTSLCSDKEVEEINAGEVKVDDYECVEKYLRTPATYGITLNILEEEYTINLIVRDTTAPVLSAKNLEIFVGSSYTIDDFIQFCVDASGECKVTFYDKDVDKEGNVIDYSKYVDAGTHKIRVIATDQFGNNTEPIELELTILQTESTLFTVTFNSNGGSAVNSIKAPEGSTIVEPASPTREGYQFVGWYVGNTKFDFNTKLVQNVTLVAKWQKNGTETPIDPGTISVSSISLDYKKINLYIGDSKTVKASVYPSNATNKNVSWSSADSSIASVTNGKITGVKEGTTTITATAGGKSASVTVVVRNASSSTCGYGDANYNTQYHLSVNLIKNNCAVDPNKDYNEVSATMSSEYRKIVDQLVAMGLSINNNYFSHKEVYAKIKNTTGTGLVGVQITVTLNVIDPTTPYVAMKAEYIIKADGTRQFISNNISKNGVDFK